jgi:hypothetical protein
MTELEIRLRVDFMILVLIKSINKTINVLFIDFFFIMYKY